MSESEGMLSLIEPAVAGSNGGGCGDGNDGRQQRWGMGNSVERVAVVMG